MLGQGAGGFALVHLQERRTADDALNTREPHDVALRFLSGLGILGLALLAVLIGSRGVGRGPRGGRAPRGPEIGLPLAILAAFALQAAVDWSWAIPALTVPAFAAAGVVLAARLARSPDRPRRPGPLAAGALAALAVRGRGQRRPALVVGACRAPTGATRWPTAARATRSTSRAGPRAANPLSLGPLLLLRGRRTPTSSDRPARALGAYERATRLQPDNPAAWRALAIFLGRGPAGAGAAWRQVHRLDPQRPRGGAAAS